MIVKRLTALHQMISSKMVDAVDDRALHLPRINLFTLGKFRKDLYTFNTKKKMEIAK